MSTDHSGAHPDSKLIDELGGVLKLHKKLNKKYQTVFNWTKRGIPAQVKLDNPDLFLKRTTSDPVDISCPQVTSAADA